MVGGEKVTHSEWTEDWIYNVTFTEWVEMKLDLAKTLSDLATKVNSMTLNNPRLPENMSLDLLGAIEQLDILIASRDNLIESLQQ